MALAMFATMRLGCRSAVEIVRRLLRSVVIPADAGISLRSDFQFSIFNCFGLSGP